MLTFEVPTGADPLDVLVERLGNFRAGPAWMFDWSVLSAELRLPVTADELFAGWDCPTWLRERVTEGLSGTPLEQAAALGLVTLHWTCPGHSPDTEDTPVIRAAKVLRDSSTDWRGQLYFYWLRAVDVLTEDLEQLLEDSEPRLTLSFALRRAELGAATWSALGIDLTLFHTMGYQLPPVDSVASVKSWVVDDSVTEDPILRGMLWVDPCCWAYQITLH